MKPFLKWAGGKMRLMPRLIAMLPPGSRLLEPFVGSGAVFLNTNYPTYLLNDLNADLIELYIILVQDTDRFVDACRAYFVRENNHADAYYALRQRFNTSTDKYERAVLFVYLNRHCFNGLSRYNAQGRFNVPFGRYLQPYFPEREMRAFAAHAASAEFACDDFRKVFARASRGDVIYCDPPYIALSQTANFTSYGAGGFGTSEQVALAACAEEASGNGITVILSNHNTAFARELYAGADRIDFFDVQRHISCDGANRAKAAELIAVYAGSTNSTFR